MGAMTNEAVEIPGDEVVAELTKVVWATVLGLPVLPREQGAEVAEGDVTTSVDIGGAWEGTVSITFSRALARQLAASMFAYDDGEVSTDELVDALGELANIVGGNVKGFLPGPCRLSVPRVEPAVRGRTESAPSRSWFECDGQPFVVSVASRGE